MIQACSVWKRRRTVLSWRGYSRKCELQPSGEPLQTQLREGRCADKIFLMTVRWLREYKTMFN